MSMANRSMYALVLVMTFLRGAAHKKGHVAWIEIWRKSLGGIWRADGAALPF
jgi:hypothetical protein